MVPDVVSSSLIIRPIIKTAPGKGAFFVLRCFTVERGRIPICLLAANRHETSSGSIGRLAVAAKSLRSPLCNGCRLTLSLFLQPNKRVTCVEKNSVFFFLKHNPPHNKNSSREGSFFCIEVFYSREGAIFKLTRTSLKHVAPACTRHVQPRPDIQVK